VDLNARKGAGRTTWETEKELVVCLNVIKQIDPLQVWRRKWSKQFIYYISRKWMDVQSRTQNKTAVSSGFECDS